MEEGLSLLSLINNSFDAKEVDVRTYSPLTLAFIGDGIYDIIIRTVIVERSNRPVNELHRRTSRFVKANTQALMIQALIPFLTEEEEAVYKRGRNAKSHTTAKNASLMDYRMATGFEALIGCLYLQDKTERILELVKRGLAEIGMEL